MCVVIDLDVVCLICLQPNKEMHPIFNTDVESSELQIAQKISILSELKIDQNNETLPSKICSKCLQDLKAAWRFRKNCQAAVTIFQTIVKLDDVQPRPEDSASKELAEQQIKVPQGLQIKRINNDNEGEDDKKPGESLIDKKTVAVEEFVLSNDKESSTLYEELAPQDYIQSQDNHPEEFQAMQNEIKDASKVEEEEVEFNENEEEVEHEDEDSIFVEYYLNEDALADESTIKIVNKNSSKAKSNMEEKLLRVRKQSPDMEEKQTKKRTEYLEKVNKLQPRGRTRAQNVQKVVAKSSQASQRNSVVIDDTNSSEESIIPVQPQVRQVKTRKRKSISPETKTPKICELCGNSYRFQHALNAHMRRHYNEKPFPCDFCDKAFVSNVELRRHMRVHTGQKPYACQYCERRFSDFGSRIKHERTHTGERPYHCITCGKSFAYPHVLSVHILTHTGEKRFRCDYCSKGFTKKAYLLSHVEQHHSGPTEFQVVIDDTRDSSQNQADATKSETFEECIYTTEIVNEAEMEECDEEYEDDDVNQEPDEIIITQSHMQTKLESNDDSEIHDIVEVESDEEYTIRER
ncbi:zinc finger protein 37 [Calliphora vicina]|uniref:zinc finger protein 37 n=1 Tax=Calliphora vicina TaxID=7373 RepID=UPI00325B263E